MTFNFWFSLLILHDHDSQVKELEDEVKSSSIITTQKELQRLREEVFKCRRSETQKERENVFLQKQLLMAAEIIASSPHKSEILHTMKTED